MLIKFEKAKCALEESLRRVEDIVPQAIGCQVTNTDLDFVNIQTTFVIKSLVCITCNIPWLVDPFNSK